MYPLGAQRTSHTGDDDARYTTIGARSSVDHRRTDPSSLPDSNISSDIGLKSTAKTGPAWPTSSKNTETSAVFALDWATSHTRTMESAQPAATKPRRAPMATQLTFSTECSRVNRHTDGRASGPRATAARASSSSCASLFGNSSGMPKGAGARGPYSDESTSASRYAECCSARDLRARATSSRRFAMRAAVPASSTATASSPASSAFAHAMSAATSQRASTCSRKYGPK
mmetsp:Transcript_8066/g.25780  ORF Transcript_8066/g.25780 Transcript_8066/m.25780 type:complete len:229 (+) Transcript_8066:3843-4529(+)